MHAIIGSGTPSYTVFFVPAHTTSVSAATSAEVQHKTDERVHGAVWLWLSKLHMRCKRIWSRGSHRPAKSFWALHCRKDVHRQPCVHLRTTVVLDRAAEHSHGEVESAKSWCLQGCTTIHDATAEKLPDAVTQLLCKSQGMWCLNFQRQFKCT